MSSYIKWIWKQHDLEFPSIFFMELDEERWDTRRVEVFPDGRTGFAGPDDRSHETWLGETAIAPLSEINEDPMFEATEISAADFEKGLDIRCRQQPPAAQTVRD